MAAARPTEGHAHRVLVRDGPRVHVIPVDKIDYVQAQDDYVCFRSEGKDYLKEQTLAETEASLDPAMFVRIHRSYLLNLARLARVDLDERENRVAVLTDGRRLPVSRAGYTRGSARSGSPGGPDRFAHVRAIPRLRAGGPLTSARPGSRRRPGAARGRRRPRRSRPPCARCSGRRPTSMPRARTA